MATNLSRYHLRSPRYVLQPLDNTLVRIAGPQQTPWEEGTEIKDISLTGLAFTAPPLLCPMVGEFIKIQFEVPGGTQMACFALVTRLKNISPTLMIVGVKYYKLEMPHRLNLAKGLSKKFKEHFHEIQRKDSKQKWSYLSSKLLIIFCYFLISAGMIHLMNLWNLNKLQF